MSDPTATLTLDNPTPNHGDTVTASYDVAGNDGTPAVVLPVHGAVTVGGVAVMVNDASVTIPAVDPLPVTYEVPTVDGLTFEPTDDPAVFTAVVP